MFNVEDCEKLWECFCCKMRSGTNEVCCYLNNHVDKRIKDSNKYEHIQDKNISFKLWTPTYKHSGDLDLHIGIDVKFDKKNTYYISFSSLNIDSNSKNIHTVPGRIQIMIGDGKPNEKLGKNEKVESRYGLCSRIFYPKMSEDSTYGGKINNLKLTYIHKNEDLIEEELKKGRKVFYTGYKLFGNNGSRDETLTKEKYGDFLDIILEFINMNVGLTKSANNDD